jgi:hypothetical protein
VWWVAKALISRALPTRRVPRPSRTLRRAGVEDASASASGCHNCGASSRGHERQNSAGSIAAHPKKRKDGAPSVLLMPARSKTWATGAPMTIRISRVFALIAALSVSLPLSAQKEFSKWPTGTSPKEIGERDPSKSA